MIVYNKKNVLKYLKQIYKQAVLVNEPLSRHTSFHIGGNADFLVQPTTLEEVVRTVVFLQNSNIPMYTLGNGTNMLVSDQGFNGVIVKMNEFSGIEEVDQELQVLSGTSLTQLVVFANNRGLGGMQDGFGIPGTVGALSLWTLVHTAMKQAK